LTNIERQTYVCHKRGATSSSARGRSGLGEKVLIFGASEPEVLAQGGTGVVFVENAPAPQFGQDQRDEILESTGQ
jgi:hypothetical protein